MSKKSDATTITLALLCASETRNFLMMQLPPMTELRDGDRAYKPEGIRRGELTGACFALGIGVVVSMIAGNPLPLTMTALVTAGMIASYEQAIRNPIATA